MASVDDAVEQFSRVYGSLHDELRGGAPWNAEDHEFFGWVSGYTGRRMANEVMRDWRDGVIDLVAPAPDSVVVEVGCGTGIIGRQLMSRCTYFGFDPDPTSVEVFTASARALGADTVGDRVRRAAGHEIPWATLPPVDVVLLSSVVQYLPSLDYLDQVIGAAHDRLGPGGRVVLADVPHRGLRDLYVLGLCLTRASSAEEAEQLLRTFMRDDHDLGELWLWPSQVRELASRRGMGVQLVRAPLGYTSEMSKFRFAVVLTTGGDSPNGAHRDAAISTHVDVAEEVAAWTAWRRGVSPETLFAVHRAALQDSIGAPGRDTSHRAPDESGLYSYAGGAGGS